MTAALSIPPHSLSIVVPFYNEEDNIAPLVKRVHEALAGYQHPWELVLVDDGSSDATVDRGLQCAREYGPHVRVVELTRKGGKAVMTFDKNYTSFEAIDFQNKRITGKRP